MPTSPRFLRLAERAITELLNQEHAFVWDELEAKVSDTAWPGLGTTVDPHALTQVKSTLMASGVLRQTIQPTRGGRRVGVFHFADLTDRRAAFERAAARKRLLHARYIGWASGTPSTPGRVGPAGETVVRASLREAAAYGYQLLKPEGGDIDRLLGADVPLGPLDNAAYLTLLDERQTPEETVLVLVEVKNVRSWIYPRAEELYQLLAKAALLQRAHPDWRIVPVFICRRPHKTTFYMASHLGFHAIETEAQFIQPFPEDSDDQRRLEEVQTELGYDLLTSVDPYEPLVRQFARTIPSVASRRARDWARTAEHFTDQLLDLRERLPDGEREDRMIELRALAREVLGIDQLGW